MQNSNEDYYRKKCADMRGIRIEDVTDKMRAETKEFLLLDNYGNRNKLLSNL